MTVLVDAAGKLRYVDEAKASPFVGAGGRAGTVRSSRTLEFERLGLHQAYAKIYASQPWVWAAVNKLARGIGRLPFKSYLNADDPDGEKDVVYLRPNVRDVHPLPMLLDRPYPRGSRSSLFTAAVGNMAIYGHACWWKYRQRAGQPPIELWPLPWQYMTIRVDDDGLVLAYEYQGPAGKKVFLADDIVHFQWWSPAGLAGTSPLEPLRVTLALEDAGRTYAVSSFANGVRPSGALVTPNVLQPEQKEDLRAEVQALNAGPDKAFRIALLDGGMDWKAFAHTSQEAETIAHRKLNREEVCAVYDIPPPVLQILDRATFSNITEQNKALYREAMGPWLTMLEETIASQLLWGEASFAGTYVEADLAEVLRADLPTRAAAYKSLETTLSMNERRALENRRAIGDVNDEANPANGVLIPLNMALAMPSGEVLVPGGATDGSGAVAGALSRLVDDALEQALAERDRAT